jgi:hypothetical protein
MFHTHSLYRGSIPQLLCTSRGTLELISRMCSLKLQQTFAVLQTGDTIGFNLLEADLQITDHATCNASYSGRVTDRMICAGNSPDFKGPCSVRGT